MCVAFGDKNSGIRNPKSQIPNPKSQIPMLFASLEEHDVADLLATYER